VILAIRVNWEMFEVLWKRWRRHILQQGKTEQNLGLSFDTFLQFHLTLSEIVMKQDSMQEIQLW